MYIFIEDLFQLLVYQANDRPIKSFLQMMSDNFRLSIPKRCSSYNDASNTWNIGRFRSLRCLPAKVRCRTNNWIAKSMVNKEFKNLNYSFCREKMSVFLTRVKIKFMRSILSPDYSTLSSYKINTIQ